MEKFFYNNPCFEYNSDGNMEIIHKYSVGPIEVLIYGITQNKEFYFDWTFPEFYPDDSELVRDYRIISKERMLKAINEEIETCKKNKNFEMAEKYINAKKYIENY